jgi:hypothetical protein
VFIFDGSTALRRVAQAFKSLLLSPRNGIGCPILCDSSRGPRRARFLRDGVEARAGVARAWAQSQRVGDNYPPTLTGPSSPNQ